MIVIAIVSAVIISILVVSWFARVEKQAQQEADRLSQEMEELRMKNLDVDFRTTTRTTAPPIKEEGAKPKPVQPSQYETSRTVSVEDNHSDFATSLAVAYATDSAILGMAVGGDPVGAMVGDALNDSEDNNKKFMEVDDSPTFETHSTDFSDSPSHDSSWDTSDSTSHDSSWDSSDSSWDSSDSSSSSFD